MSLEKFIINLIVESKQMVIQFDLQIFLLINIFTEIFVICIKSTKWLNEG